jgi:uncharacterized membrane protein
MTLRRFKTVALLLCTACLALAGWMLFHSLTGVRMVGCGAGSGCDSVMGSPWAYVLGGVPVSLPAAVAYLLLGLCVLFFGGETEEDRSLDRILWPMMLVLGGAIFGAALWFCYLQLFVLHAFCKYCTLLHLLGCVLAGWILLAGRPFGRLRNRSLFVVGLLAAALFAIVQSRTLPAAAYDAGRTEVALPSFSEGEIPVLGPSDAPDELTLLFDFQCNHCRWLHRVLPDLLEKAGGQYRIRLCPVPLSSACNPYIPSSGIDRFVGSCQLTRYALAVWYARPDAYEAYWDYLLGSGDERAAIAPADAEARAGELLGDDFESAIQNPRIDAYLRKVEELFGRTSSSQKSGVPRLIRGQHWLVPETDQADELLELIRLSL